MNTRGLMPGGELRMRYSIAALATVLLVLAVTASSETFAQEEKKITYADDVQPILRQHCFICHSQSKKTNDLAVDSYESLMTGGAAGEAIAPGDPDSSYLYMLVSHQEEPKMPPNQGRIEDAKLEIIRKWIEGGAPKDQGSKVEAKKKPTMDLAVSGGANKPEGPPPMPEVGLNRQPVHSTPRPGPVTALAASPWGPLVAIAGQEQIVLYNSDTFELLGILPFPEGIPYVLKFSRSGSLLLAGGGVGADHGKVIVFDVKTGNRVMEVGDEMDAVLAADINASQSLIALGGPQRLVRVYSTADGSLVTEIKKHTDWIYAVEFSPDGVLLATADRAGGLWVWEAGTNRDFYGLVGHQAAVTDVSWRADSNVLASASQDGTVRLWNMQDGKQIKSISAHGGGATAVEFTHDGRIVSCGRDKVAKVWDASGNPVRSLETLGDIAMQVAFTHDGGRVVAGDWAGEVRVWNTADGARLASLTANPPAPEAPAEAEAQQAEQPPAPPPAEQAAAPQPPVEPSSAPAPAPQ